MNEDNFQIAAVAWIKLQYPKLLLHHSPNGGKRNGREALKFKRMGTRPGCPDIMIYRQSEPYAGLAIELKVGRNTVRDSQGDFMAELRENGWYCAVAYNLDVVMKTVNGYMSNAKEL